MTRRATSPTNGAALPGLPFPLAAGDRCEFEALSTALRAFDGAVSIVTQHPERHAHDVAGAVYRVMCLNGSARNGEQFDAYESELSR